MSDDFDRVMKGLESAVEISADRADPSTYRVYVPDDVDVKAIRGRLGLSQNVFAATFGFSSSAVKEWEQRRRKPEASARVLLTLIDREPDAVRRALSDPKDRPAPAFVSNGAHA